MLFLPHTGEYVHEGICIVHSVTFKYYTDIRMGPLISAPGMPIHSHSAAVGVLGL